MPSAAPRSHPARARTTVPDPAPLCARPGRVGNRIAFTPQQSRPAPTPPANLAPPPTPIRLFVQHSLRPTACALKRPSCTGRAAEVATTLGVDEVPASESADRCLSHGWTATPDTSTPTLWTWGRGAPSAASAPTDTVRREGAADDGEQVTKADEHDPYPAAHPAGHPKGGPAARCKGYQLGLIARHGGIT